MKRLLLILLILLPTQAHALHPAAQRNLAEAQQQLAAENYRAAATTLSAFIERRPEFNDAQLEFTLGNAYAMQNMAEEAAGHYAAALKLDPHYAPAWLNLGKMRFDLEDYGTAAECFMQAYASKPEPQVLYQASVCYMQAGQPEKALPGLEKLAGEENVSWLNALLQCYMLLDEPAKGAKITRQLLKLEPEQERWWMALARCSLMRSDYAGALAALKSRSLLLELQPREVLILGDLSMAAALPLQAVNYYEDYLNSKYDAEVVDKLIKANLAAHKPEQSLAVIEKYMNPDLRMFKGRILYQQGEYELARQCFAVSKGAEASLLAGYCSVALEDYMAAKLHFSKAAEDKKQRKRAQEMLESLSQL